MCEVHEVNIKHRPKNEKQRYRGCELSKCGGV